MQSFKIMYIAKIPTKTKSGNISHMCYLLREGYRVNGKVKTKTIANITHWNKQDLIPILKKKCYKAAHFLVPIDLIKLTLAANIFQASQDTSTISS